MAKKSTPPIPKGKLPKRADNGQITTMKFVIDHPKVGYLQKINQAKPKPKKS